MLNKNIHINDLIASLADEISAESQSGNVSYSNTDVQSIKSELNQVWDDSASYKSEVTFNSQNAFNSFKERVSELETLPQVTETKVVTLKSRYQYLTGIAATAALLVGVWFLYPSDIITYDNSTDSPQQFSLVDGSNLYLFPGASLEISKNFSKENRNLNLNTGQVIIDVESSKVPFIVNIEDNDIVVTGTQFSANHRESDITINLYEGSINYQYDDKVIVCSQGSKLIHNRLTGVVKKIDGVDQSLIDFAQGKLSFIDTPLDQVFTRLEQFYNVKFSRNKDFDSDLHFTSAVLDNQSLENIIKTLEVSFNLEITQEDDSNYSIEL